MNRSTPRPVLRIALDTTFAGTNPTGVGLYSRRLAAQLHHLSARENLSVSCIGPACGSRHDTSLIATMQEWPIYTQAVVPVLLAKQRSHIVHSTSHLGPIIGPAQKIITVHDLLFLKYPADYNPIWLAITKALLPPLLQRAAAIIADSRATARDIRRFYGTPASKINVIYPGVDRYAGDTASAQQAVTTSGRTTDVEPYILCLGPWVGRKNLGVVVSAFEQLAARDEKIRLVITGGLPRGMKGEGPVALVKLLPRQFQSRVELAGHVPTSELRELVRGASMLTYPSRAEGFGLPPLEAMSVGVPVVAADTSVAREVYGDAALYAPPDDADAWAETVGRLITDEAMRARLRAAGFARSARFTWERCAGECIALYRRVLATSS